MSRWGGRGWSWALGKSSCRRWCLNWVLKATRDLKQGLWGRMSSIDSLLKEGSYNLTQSVNLKRPQPKRARVPRVSHCILAISSHLNEYLVTGPRWLRRRKWGWWPCTFLPHSNPGQLQVMSSIPDVMVSFKKGQTQQQWGGNVSQPALRHGYRQERILKVRSNKRQPDW